MSSTLLAQSRNTPVDPFKIATTSIPRMEKACLCSQTDMHTAATSPLVLLKDMANTFTYNKMNSKNFTWRIPNKDDFAIRDNGS